MAWLTDAEGKAAVAAALHAGGYSALAADGAFWGAVIPSALSTAKQDILSILIDRGFTAAQIDTWDFQFDCHRQQTVYWALIEGQGLLGLDPTLVSLVDHLDRREWLKAAVLLDGGEVIDPVEEDEDGPIGYGKLATGDAKFGGDAW